MTQTIRIQVLFTEETVMGGFTDALYFDPVEFETIKDSEIEAMKQARVDAWLQVVGNPPEPVEPTKGELQAELASLDALRAELVLKIEEKG